MAKIQRTTREMRELYAKHIQQYQDYIDGTVPYFLKNCYFCQIDRIFGGNSCSFCILGNEYQHSNECSVSGPQIMYEWEESPVGSPQKDAMPTKASVRARMVWLEKQIAKFTDCEIY